MPIRMWDGTSDWMDGTVELSPGDDNALDAGEVRMWPWVGGVDLIGNLSWPVFAADGFGKGEWNSNTAYAAGQLFTSDTLGAVLPRLCGACNVHKLSGETGVDSLVLADTAPSETTVAAWNSKTIASPVGGTAQPASFWQNSTYPAKSVAVTWTDSHVLIARATAAAAAILSTWITDNNAQNSVIVACTDYTTCTTLAGDGISVLYDITSGVPGNGTIASAATIAAAGIDGILLPTSNTTAPLVETCHAAGLRYWVWNCDTAAVAAGYIDMGVDGIWTAYPSIATQPVIPPPPPDPDPDPGDPPANIGTWFGWTDRGTSPSSLQSAGMTPIGVVRTFNGVGDFTIASSQYNGTHPVWISFKPSSATAMETPETWVPGIMTEMKARFAKGRSVFCGLYHEPEGDRPSTWSVSRWIAAWQEANGYLYDLCVAARAQGWNFWTAPIICDWTFNDTSKGAAWEWYSANWTKYDVMGFDVYPTGQKADGSIRIARLRTISDYNIAAYVNGPGKDSWFYIQKCADLAQQRNKPWGSGECGIIAGKLFGGDSLHYYRLDQRAGRLRNIYNQLLALPNPPRLWTWWINDSCNVHLFDPPDTEGLRVINDSVKGNPTSQPRP